MMMMMASGSEPQALSETPVAVAVPVASCTTTQHRPDNNHNHPQQQQLPRHEYELVLDDAQAHGSLHLVVEEGGSSTMDLSLPTKTRRHTRCVVVPEMLRGRLSARQWKSFCSQIDKEWEKYNNSASSGTTRRSRTTGATVSTSSTSPLTATPNYDAATPAIVAEGPTATTSNYNSYNAFYGYNQYCRANDVVAVFLVLGFMLLVALAVGELTLPWVGGCLFFVGAVLPLFLMLMQSAVEQERRHHAEWAKAAAEGKMIAGPLAELEKQVQQICDKTAAGRPGLYMKVKYRSMAEAVATTSSSSSSSCHQDSPLVAAEAGAATTTKGMLMEPYIEIRRVTAEEQISPLGVLGIDYVEHVVLPTDTLEGLCLQYKISATRIRQCNCFFGASLLLAPKILFIPIRREGGPSFLQDPASKTYKIHALRAKVPSLRMNEAMAYLELADWNLEAAIQEVKDDYEWEQQQQGLLPRDSVNAEEASTSATTTTTTTTRLMQQEEQEQADPLSIEII